MLAFTLVVFMLAGVLGQCDEMIVSDIVNCVRSSCDPQLLQRFRVSPGSLTEDDITQFRDCLSSQCSSQLQNLQTQSDECLECMQSNTMSQGIDAVLQCTQDQSMYGGAMPTQYPSQVPIDQQGIPMTEFPQTEFPQGFPSAYPGGF